ncbi:MAG: DUF1211 domain-containing protein [Faecalicoccus sp.]|nr:DUF1211 domain-containing protein [Faecalicoccus sp.]
MTKDRLCAFMDAILAIIMTILVLELKKPAEASWSALWALRADFFSYAVSFFWLGAMWVNIHNRWVSVERIDNKVLWASIVMLFFASFFPYVTSFVSENFENLFAQMFYSVIVMLVSFANMALSRAIVNINKTAGEAIKGTQKIVAADLAIKGIGILMGIFIYPPFAMIGIILAGCVMTFLPLYLNKHKQQ